MMPARYRGRTDIWINGTYWLGAILGTFASFLLLNSMRPNEGWRVAFLMRNLLPGWALTPSRLAVSAAAAHPQTGQVHRPAAGPAGMPRAARRTGSGAVRLRRAG